ncbi:retropepsin-like domain-containing protein [Algoriphagus sp. AGSA1]|uniref:retropepsin-like aspartic protease n=1 Tax=Algoriphagus sp. AGSA1 TaxID=2907213 RepID=UPI001F298D7E|nr:retropepsin-like aspartic protease [Algoriphagus sp. AGSA1]MCE7053871.1 retropepsin-like domain-containing protein [Algoriphagus sp. AGSA1]
MKYFVLGLLLLNFNLTSRAQKNSYFTEIYTEIGKKDFFKAAELLELDRSPLSNTEKNILSAILKNAFNQTNQSKTAIANLLDQSGINLPDSIRLKLLEVRHDNAYKSYDYAKAKEAVSRILQEFAHLLHADQVDGYKNSLKIWSILEHQPPQKTEFLGSVQQQMIRDLAGLNNLLLTTKRDSIPMIFDTGANLSTITRSAAKRLQMKVLPDSIQVGTITGTMVYANLGICEKLALESAVFSNVVFLVLADEHLAFPQIDYQIHGILGFPVMESLRRIRIDQNGHFEAGFSGSTIQKTVKANMAMDGLSLLVQLEGKHFYLDTGADESMLYPRYYSQNKEEIESKYELEEIQFGGAGGHGKFPGYQIDFRIKVNDTELSFPNTPLLTESRNEKWKHVYGNIGQDLIDRFGSMTLDFENMQLLFTPPLNP